jgi:Bacterial Ig-like domain
MAYPSTTPFRYGALAALVVLGACTDSPVSPSPKSEAGFFFVTAYDCTVDVQSGTTNCQLQPTGGANGPMLDIITGSPYVSFTSSIVAVSNGNSANSDTTTLTLTLHNNIPQPIGTSDGTTPHANGTRMFFKSGPIVTTAAYPKPQALGISAANALGPASFTNVDGTTSYLNRLYYQINGVVAQNDSASAQAVFVYDSRATSFSYTLLVASPVPYDYGWITISSAPVLTPGQTTTLTGTAYNVYGNVRVDGMTWSSSDSAVATVDAWGGVTAVGEGTATITATSTIVPQRTGALTITVDAAPTVNGTSPASNATGVSPSSDIVITFSEAVNVSTASFSVECPAGWFGTFTVSGSGTSTITLNPNSNFPAATLCDVTVFGSQVSDGDANDGPDLMTGTYAFSFQTS